MRTKSCRVVQAAALLRPLPVSDVQPLLPDDRQQDVALADRPVEVFPTIDPERDGVDVHEDVVASEARFQAV